MKRELPAGAEKRCFVGSSFCFSDFEKLLLTTNTPIGIQGGNSVKKLEEFLELGVKLIIQIVNNGNRAVCRACL